MDSDRRLSGAAIGNEEGIQHHACIYLVEKQAGLKGGIGGLEVDIQITDLGIRPGTAGAYEARRDHRALDNAEQHVLEDTRGEKDKERIGVAAAEVKMLSACDASGEKQPIAPVCADAYIPEIGQKTARR